LNNRVFVGRKKLFTSLEPTRENLPKILEKIFPQHLANSQEIDYLYRYYKGDQPILNRVKKIRPEICNKTVENHAYEIVEFKTGYMFGQPVQYVQRQREDNHEGEEQTETNRVATLNELMYLNDKVTHDRELGEWMIVSGTGYRLVLPSNLEDVPFEIETLDPRNSFVVYSTGFGKKPILGGTYRVEDEDGNYRIGLYSNSFYWEIVYNGLDEIKFITEKPHVLHYVPIIEYPANPARLGAFEPVLELLDALNNIVSNRIDGIEQFIQHIMKFINCEISAEDFKELKELGAIKITSSEGRQADVEIMTQELNQDQTQTLVDYLYQTILTITGVPDRRASSGGNTGQALTIGQGWTNAEARAVAMEQMFKSSENKFLRIVLRILNDSSNVNIGDLKLSDIDVKFNRNKTDNLLVKTQGLQNMLEAGIHPRIAIANSNLFPDPEQVFVDSSEYLRKWKIDKGEEERFQKPNPPDIY
jgi:SPP1 family phage portal protein